MLEHYFGPGLLIYVGDILKRDPPMQAGCTGLGQARAQSRQQNRRHQGRIESDRFDVSIYHCSLTNLGKSAAAAPRPVAVVADRGSLSAGATHHR